MLEVEFVRAGEITGLAVMGDNDVWSGRSSLRCCRNDSCCSWRRRYFCRARSRLWFPIALVGPRLESGSALTGVGVAIVLLLARCTVGGGNRT